MEQITLDEPFHFSRAEVEVPAPGPGEALVRVHRIGVCGTDLHAFAGNQNFFSYPRICGHELGVELVEVPENDRGLNAGDACAVEPYLACGRCHSCKCGRSNCCENIQVLGVHTDGGMRDFFCVPLPYLHRSDSLSMDQLALIEPLSISDHAVLRSGLKPGERALVVGAGPIGLAAVQFALAAGAEVTVLELDPDRRNFVASATGATVLSAPTDSLYEVVFDATGNKQAMEASFRSVHFGGRLVLIGHTRGEISFDNPLFHSREMTLLASRNSAGRFGEIIGMIEAGEIDTTPWITHRLALSDVPGRFKDLAGSAGLVKAMIDVAE